MSEIVKLAKPEPDPREQYLLAMWLMFLRAPGIATAPGEIVDLGEIGEVRETRVRRASPYSIAEPEFGKP